MQGSNPHYISNNYTGKLISPIHLQKGSNQPTKIPHHYTTQNRQQTVNMSQKNIRESIFQSV